MAVHQLTCAHCGGQFVHDRRKPYCNTQCRSAARRERVRQRDGKVARWADGVPACRKVHVCLTCKKTFTPKRAGRTRFCGRECAYDWKALVAKLSKPVCVRMFRAKPKAAKVKCCRGCGEETSKGKQYCQACRANAVLERKQRAIIDGTRAAARKARKLKLRGVAVEAVNPLKVLERDAWRCQLCGVSTPKKLRGTYEDRAPEVDHIIPLAQGGEHSYRNTQCACRRCNITKGGKALGQLRLVA